MKCVIVAILLMAAALVPTTTTMAAYASHSVSANACQGDGYEAGQNGEFSQELYEFCEEYGDEYYDGFINGCMDAGNSRDVCEHATDAG
jgi:hypothetical protein